MSEAAERLRQEGNEWFKLGKFDKAIVSYTKAIEAQPTAALYSNRAFCNVKMSFSGEAIHDADEALAMDPTFIKARYRKATAFLQLGKLKEAVKELRAVTQIAPTDADAQQKLAACEKELKRIRFLDAIASDDTMPTWQQLKPEQMSVPADYDGPRLPEDGTVTLEYVQGMMQRFKDQKLISRRDLASLMIQAVQVLRAHPNVVPVSFADDEHITVCGDTHGQYYDLLNIFEMNGLPSPTNRYVFNGDFVDRGSYSLENVMVLLAFKVLYPNHFFLSRGNHESLNLNRMYGFEGEVKAKYDEKMFSLFQDVFHSLPLAHVLNKRVFVAHGGLFAKDGVTIEDINKENRFRDMPEEGLMVEMLWSDPQEFPGRRPNKRGVGVAFGQDVTEDFLRTNGLELIVRSHEVSDGGYVEMHGGKLITVFSAPNYCDQVGNKGAFIRFNGDDMKPKITTFSHVPHPGKRPMAYSSMGMMGMGM